MAHGATLLCQMPSKVRHTGTPPCTPTCTTPTCTPHIRAQSDTTKYGEETDKDSSIQPNTGKRRTKTDKDSSDKMRKSKETKRQAWSKKHTYRVCDGRDEREEGECDDGLCTVAATCSQQLVRNLPQLCHASTVHTTYELANTHQTVHQTVQHTV